MGLFRLGKGLVRIVKGASEGDIEKIGKGFLEAVIGAVTLGSDSEDHDIDDD